MTKGVIYYNTGRKCLVRLLTTLYSLRRHYSGDVTILSEGQESHEYCKPIAEAFGANFLRVQFKVPEGPQGTFLKKTLLYEATPYDISVFIDSDSLVVGEFSKLFEWAEKYQFVATNFANWRSNGKILSSRIRNWEKHYPELIDDALKFGPALNAGVYAFRRDAEFLKVWYDMTLPGRDIYLPEETSMQVILPQFPNYVAPQQYNCSCKFSNPFDPDTRIIHYHRNKHCRIGLPFGAQRWIDNFQKVLDANIANVKQWYLQWDGTLRRYIKSQETDNMEPVATPNIITQPKAATPYIRNDVTLVTAVSKNMEGIFKGTVPTWVGKPQFRSWPLLVFVNGFDDPERELRPVIGHKDVRFVQWNMPKYDSMRELMISSFVLGAAQHVTTDYWVKLDIDTYFSTPEDLFTPRDFQYDVIGHRWGQSILQFLIRLDQWANLMGLPGNNFIPIGKVPTVEREKFGHSRFISWCCLHKTEFVREAANLAGDRLPVPSHDTYLWYIANRLGRKWGSGKFNAGAGHSKRWKKAKAGLDNLKKMGAIQ